MNTTKAHIAALSLLDRALISITDDEMKALLAGLPEDHMSAIRRISGLRPSDGSDADATGTKDGPTAPATPAGSSTTGSSTTDSSTTDSSTTDSGTVDHEVVEAIRLAAHKGRLNGDLQRLGVVLSDACLADCVEKLGDKSDMPSEDELKAVLPGLVENHGVGTVRLMLASTVVGEAPASAVIVDLLKNDDLVKLPAVEPKPLAPLLPRKEDDPERLRLKAQRRDRKAQEQAAAKLRREQIAHAKNRA